MYPERFITTSDYGTLKNDSSAITLTLTIPNGFVYNSSNPIIATQTISVGTINALIRSRITSSKRSFWTVGTFFVEQVSIQPTGFPASPTNVYCSLTRISPTEMQATAYTEYYTGGPNLTVRETVTVTFIFNTFLSPLL